MNIALFISLGVAQLAAVAIAVLYGVERGRRLERDESARARAAVEARTAEAVERAEDAARVEPITDLVDRWGGR